MRIKPRNLSLHFDKNRVVTDPNPLDSDHRAFNPNGIFSTDIFGSMTSGEDYTCNCPPHETDALKGKFNEGVLCPKCNHRVEYKGLMIEKAGWIELCETVIHPYFYLYIKKIIGGANLKRILTFKGDIEVGGELIEPPLVAPYEGIGFKRFIENFEEILNHFVNKGSKKETNGEDFRFIMTNIEMVFIKHYPIINVKLRPAMVVDGRFSFEAINNLYNQLITNSNLLKSFSDVERIPLNTEPLTFRNQDLLNQVFDDITQNLSKKEGYIRCTLLGNRVNWSSRMVITPLPIGYNADEIVIPYNTALEFSKPIILNKLTKLNNISLIEANEIFQKAHSKFNKIVYEMAVNVVTSENFGLLVNRNPKDWGCKTL